MEENNKYIFCKEKEYTLYQGKMQEVLSTLEENSIDSIVCDPPYELNFMNEGWDNSGVAFQKETWEHCFKVLKSGGYLLAFGGSRTFHRIAVAIEDAGFEIRDTIMWLYGSGFPKSMNIGLAIDKKNGVESKVVGVSNKGKGTDSGSNCYNFNNGKSTMKKEFEIKQAQNQWQGWGTCLKPAYEPVIVARKPFKGSLVDNVIKNGVGGLNIDECRIDYNGEIPNIGGRANHTRGEGYGFKALKENCEANSNGRFPANIILDNSEVINGSFPSGGKNGSITKEYECNNRIYGKQPNKKPFNAYDDEGSVARYFKHCDFNDKDFDDLFFYCAKASKKDRDEGLDLFEEKQRTDGYIRTNSETARAFGANSSFGKNIHPTVKPVELMQYLVRLVSPKGATILDCFMGSGSTGKAVMFENRERNANYHFIGVEMTEKYLPICHNRIDYALNKYEYELEKENQELKEKGIMTIFDLMD